MGHIMEAFVIVSEHNYVFPGSREKSSFPNFFGKVDNYVEF